MSSVLLKSLPFVEPDRFVVLWEDFSARGGFPRSEASLADYMEWKTRSRSFEDMAALNVWRADSV